MSKEKTAKGLMHYVSKLFFFAPLQCTVTLLLMLGLGLVEGVGLLMLIPLLEIAGFNFGHSVQLPMGLGHLFKDEHFSLLAVLGVYFIVLNAFSILKYLRAVLGANLRERFTQKMRSDLYASLAEAEYDFIAHQRESDVLHVMTMETTRAGQAAHFFLGFLTTTFLIAVYALFFFYLSFKLALVAVACSVVLFGALRFLNKRSLQVGEKTFSSYQDFYQLMGQFFRCIKYTKQASLQQQQLNQFNEVASSLSERQIIFQKIASKTTWFYTSGSVLLICVMFYLALKTFHFMLADMLIFLAIYVRLLSKVSSSQTSFQNLISMLPAFRAVGELREQALRARVSDDVQEFSFECTIELKSVSFSYSKAEILHDLSFCLKKGSLTLLLGPNGAGKSTLADLMVGLLKPSQGEILIDGQPLKNRHAWQNQLAYVSQNGLLFHLSIRENLLMAKPDAGDDTLWRMLETTGVADAVKALPLGLDMPIHKAQVSGGETQKIALARALLSDPEVLILDEAMSSMDQDSRQSLSALISSLKSHMTIFMITHNQIPELQVDQVLRLENGYLVINKVGAIE